MIAIAFLFVRMLCVEAEILVLRHQLNVLQQHAPRHKLQLRWIDRALFTWLYRRCPRILDAIKIVRPETIVSWHRKGIAAYWRWKSRPRGGRPRIAKEVRDLIRRMSLENPLWGAARSMANCLSWASRSPNPRFQSIWYRGEIGHCRAGRPSFAIIWRGLRRSICSWSRRLRFSNYSHFSFSGTNGDSCCGLR